MNNKITGNLGEDIATEYLKSINYNIVRRNFRCRCGEIDIIAIDKNEIVFIEVKTRNFLGCGNPSEAVDKNKQKHIYMATKYYLYKNNLENHFVRFDVIEVYLKENQYKIEHLKGVEIYK